MRVSVCALTTAAALILTTAGILDRATAAQTPAPAVQPPARRLPGQEPRRTRDVSPEDRAKIEAARRRRPARSEEPRKISSSIVGDLQRQAVRRPPLDSPRQPAVQLM